MTSYCPHCEDWHEGICQDIPRGRTLIVGIDTPYYGSMMPENDQPLNPNNPDEEDED